MEPAEQSPMVSSPHSGPRSTRTCGQFTNLSAPVYVSVMLFAMSTWIAIVGVWVEMPLLVHALPESWKLPSYLVIIIQCANLGPAIYAIWDKVRQRNQQATHERGQQQQQCQSYVDAEVIVSLIVILTVIISMLLLALFWNQTIVVASVNRSVVLLVLVSFASLSCCTSSVVFLPYMARFPPVYISAYYFGQGLCGLVPGILGLAQLAGQEPQCHNRTDINGTGTTSSFDTRSVYSAYYYSDPRFSVSTFFALIFVLLCVSMIAFCCLNFVHACRSKMTAMADERQLTNVAEVPSATEGSEQKNSDTDVLKNDNATVQTQATYVLQRRRYISLFMTILIISALWNGILPATQTYTCLPYGNMVYRLSVCLSWVVSPLATLPNMLAPTSSMWLIVGLGSVASMLSALHLLLAAQSPHPILQGSVIGQVIVVSRLALHPLLLCSVSYCPRASGLFGSTSLFFFQLFCKRAFLWRLNGNIFYGRTHFLSPNLQWQSTEGNTTHWPQVRMFTYWSHPFC